MLSVCYATYPRNKIGDETEIDFLSLLTMIVAMRKKDGITDLKAMFKIYDVDQNGLLDLEELTNLLTKIEPNTLDMTVKVQ